MVHEGEGGFGPTTTLAVGLGDRELVSPSAKATDQRGHRARLAVAGFELREVMLTPR